MICSSEKRFFTSNLLLIEDWTPNRFATQSRGDVGGKLAFDVRVEGDARPSNSLRRDGQRPVIRGELLLLVLVVS
ncbi:hypothetical protein EGS96_17210 [Stenotrophomonas maltophilia]|nr:hypothetical protein EGS96_17210 [Stenotrophomonas maltophilia]